MSSEQEDAATVVEPAGTVADGPRAGASLILHSSELGASLVEAVAGQLAFSRYPLIRRLGHGGAGEVFLAYDPRLDRKVAIKILATQGILGHTDAVARTRLVREAQAMARSPHPNIVSVYDVDTYENERGEVGVFIVMEYVEGPNLAEWFQRRRWSWRKVLRVMVPAGRGLAAAHEVGVVHRDFKPANVIVGGDGRPRVLDFGLARGTGLLAPSLTDGERPLVPPELEVEFEGAPLDLTLTMEGRVLGTPAYMAPEQHRGALADERADQFAFCVSVWEGLYGRRPFTAKTFVELEEEKRTRRPVPVEGVRVPTWIRDALRRGLSPRPEDRWPSMVALLEALRTGTVRRRRSGGILAGAVAVALAIGGGWMHSRSTRGLCVAADRATREVWSEQRRVALADESSDAAVDGPRPLVAIDAWMQEWAAQHGENCERTRIAGSQPAAIMDLRERCLERQLRAVDRTLSRFEDDDWQPRARVDALVSFAVHLPALDECADEVAVRAQLPEPATVELAAAVRELHDDLSRVDALRHGRRLDEAWKGAAAAALRGEQLGFQGSLAEALLARGELESLAGEPWLAEQTWLETYATAVACGHDAVAARAATRLIDAQRGEHTRLGPARSWARIAEASLQRAGLPQREKADISLALAEVHVDANKLERARELVAEALEILELDAPANDPRRARALLVLARASADAPEQASRAEQDAIAMLRRLYGDGHPELLRADERSGDAPPGTKSPPPP